MVQETQITMLPTVSNNLISLPIDSYSRFVCLIIYFITPSTVNRMQKSKATRYSAVDILAIAKNINLKYG